MATVGSAASPRECSLTVVNLAIASHRAAEAAVADVEQWEEARSIRTDIASVERRPAA